MLTSPKAIKFDIFLYTGSSMVTPCKLRIKHKTLNTLKIVNILIRNVSTINSSHFQKNATYFHFLKIIWIYSRSVMGTEMFTIFEVSIVLCFTKKLYGNRNFGWFSSFEIGTSSVYLQTNLEKWKTLTFVLHRLPMIPIRICSLPFGGICCPPKGVKGVLTCNSRMWWDIRELKL